MNAAKSAGPSIAETGFKYGTGTSTPKGPGRVLTSGVRHPRA